MTNDQARWLATLGTALAGVALMCALSAVQPDPPVTHAQRVTAIRQMDACADPAWRSTAANDPMQAAAMREACR